VNRFPKKRRPLLRTEIFFTATSLKKAVGMDFYSQNHKTQQPHETPKKHQISPGIFGPVAATLNRHDSGKLTNRKLYCYYTI